MKDKQTNWLRNKKYRTFFFRINVFLLKLLMQNQSKFEVTEPKALDCTSFYEKGLF